VASYKNFDPDVAVPPMQSNGQVKTAVQPVAQKPQTPTPPQQPQPQDHRQNLEYKTALELELWKETEKQSYLTELKKLKSSQILELTDQFKKRELERESGYRKKLLEYEHLEKELKTGLVNLADREKNICSQEKELTEMRDNIISDKNRFTLDSKANIERVKKEFSHELGLEKRTNQNLQLEITEKNEKIKTQSIEVERLKRTIDKLQEQYHNRPEVKFENENKFLITEKNNLLQKLEESNKSKIYYKSQWSHCLKELARIKEENQENQRSQIQKEAEELKMLKTKLLLNSEQNRILTVQKELNIANTNLTNGLTEKALNLEYDRLHGVAKSSSEHSETPKGPQLGANEPQILNVINDPINQHAARLISEREALMATGAYSAEDLVIRQLDGRIKEAL